MSESPCDLEFLQHANTEAAYAAAKHRGVLMSGWLGLGSGFKSASTPRHQKEKPADTEGGFGVLTNDADCPTVQNETCVANKSRLCGHAPTIQYLLYSSQRGEGWIMYVNW